MPDAIAVVSVGSGGVVTARFRSPADLAGRSLVFVPRADEERTVHWSCSSPDIDPGRLPADYR